MKTASDVLQFWFIDHGQEDWFGAKPDFDTAVASSFTDTHAVLAHGEGWRWRGTADGRLAEIIVLDQSRGSCLEAGPRRFQRIPWHLRWRRRLSEAGTITSSSRTAACSC